MPVFSSSTQAILDKTYVYPSPSEKEKISKALKNFRNLLASYPQRKDKLETMFIISDLLVGRNAPGDYQEAMKIYDQIAMNGPSPYLKGRCLIGKAELMIGDPGEFDNAISLCEEARKLLGNDLGDFFDAKTYVVEAELRTARNNKGDWALAIRLFNQVIKEKDSHPYFRGRALLGKAEVILYRGTDELTIALKYLDYAYALLEERIDDYFTNKVRLVRGELLVKRGSKADKLKASKVLTAVSKIKFDYIDIIARAKLDLIEIVKPARGKKLYNEVIKLKNLPSYLRDKAKIVKQHHLS